MKNIVMTGATSFIGSSTAKILLGNNRVYAVTRKESKHLDRLPNSENLKPVFSSLGEIEKISEDISSAETWVHLGWAGTKSQDRMNRVLQVRNVEDSMKVLQVAASLGCERFIFSGSQAEYGPHNDLITESTTCIPASEYGKAKLDFGNKAREFCERHGIDFVHARIFSVFGYNDNPDSLISTCFNAFNRGGDVLLTECRQRWNFLYIDDMAKALIALIEHPTPLSDEGCVYNIASDDTRVLRKFVEALYALSRKKGGYVYGGQKVEEKNLFSLVPDISKLKRITGWKPETSFEDGIQLMMTEDEKYLD